VTTTLRPSGQGTATPPLPAIPPIADLLAQVKAADRHALDNERQRRLSLISAEQVRAQLDLLAAEAQVSRTGVRTPESVAAQERSMTLGRRRESLEGGELARGRLVRAAIDRHGRDRLLAGLMTYLRNRCPSAAKLDRARLRLGVNSGRLANPASLGNADEWRKHAAEDRATIAALESQLPREQRAQAEAMIRMAETGGAGFCRELAMMCRQGAGCAPMAQEIDAFDVATMRLLGCLIDIHEHPDG
jgi:hypothetical protein